jgi:UDP-N-acetylmuramyl pentapeptide synthase
VGRLGCVVVSGAAGALNLGLQVGQALLEPQLEGALVLVKASRGVALEKVVAALVEPA